MRSENDFQTVLSPTSGLQKSHDFLKSLWSDSLLPPLPYYSNVSWEIQYQHCSAASAQSVMQVAWCATSEVNSKIPACQCGQGLQRVDIRKQNRKSVLKVLVWLWDSPAPTAFLGSQLWLHLFHCCLLIFLCISTGCTDTNYYCITIQMRGKSLTFMQENESLRWYSCFAAAAILELSDAKCTAVRETGTTEWNAASPLLDAAHLTRHKLGCLGQTHCLFTPALCGDNTLKAIPWAGWDGLSHTLTHRTRKSSNITSSQQYRFPHMPSSLVLEPTFSPVFDLPDS